jgi:hypothetical protein
VRDFRLWLKRSQVLTPLRVTIDSIGKKRPR